MEYDEDVGWVCEFCKETYLDPEEAAGHEARCDKKPVLP